jgi:hypothetical protein
MKNESISNVTDKIIIKQELSLKKDVRRSTNIIFFYEQYFTETTRPVGFKLC